MAIEVPIRKEITEHESKVFLGMSVRQLLFAAGAAAVCIPVFLVTYKSIGVNSASLILMFIAAPFGAFGFIKPKGYTMEKWLKILYRHRIRPQRRLAKTDNYILAFYGEDANRNPNDALQGRTQRKLKPGEECDISHVETRASRKQKIQQCRKAARAGKKECKQAAREFAKAQKLIEREKNKKGAEK